MLSLNEFSAGQLKDVKELSLLLPRDQYEDTFLLAPYEGKINALVLDGPHKYMSFDAATNTHYSGFIIPGVEIRVDEASVFNADNQQPTFGALIRKASQAFIVAQMHNQGFRETVRVPFMTELPSLSDSVSVGFYRWSVTIGAGHERRDLIKVDVSPATADN